MKKDIVPLIASGGVGVLATDTLYGVVASAFDSEAVSWVYHVKKRDPKKPLIVLLSSLEEVSLFGITLSDEQREVLEQVWPGPVSVILPLTTKKYEYLHRGSGGVAFRVPDKKPLLDLLKKTGPIVAPSANIEGKKPAKNITEAKKYFGDLLDFYVSAGTITKSKASSVISLAKDGTIETLRS